MDIRIMIQFYLIMTVKCQDCNLLLDFPIAVPELICEVSLLSIKHTSVCVHTLLIHLWVMILLYMLNAYSMSIFYANCIHSHIVLFSFNLYELILDIWLHLTLITLLFVLDTLAFQQLEIDYVIGESHKELLPNSSGPAAILRIFGVTRDGNVSS